MITLTHLNYPDFDLTRMHMQPGDVFQITDEAAIDSVGLVCLVGGCEHVDPSASLHLPQAGEGLFLNDPATGWENNAAVALRAAVETEWVCVGVRGDQPRPRLEYCTVAGASLLEAGAGVIVVSGDIAVDDVRGGADAYFAPRPTNTTLGGQGAVILVRRHEG